MSSTKNLFSQTLEQHSETIRSLNEIHSDIDAVATLMIQSLEEGGKIIWMGNGGSAADAQHLAAELVVRFKKNRRALASIALTTDSSVLTACGNDFGYDVLFQRQVEALCSPKDVVVGISTSGNSANIIKGIEAAKDLHAKTVGFLGRNGGAMKELVDHQILVRSEYTDRTQEAHILIGHYLCEVIENALGD